MSLFRGSDLLAYLYGWRIVIQQHDDWSVAIAHPLVFESVMGKQIDIYCHLHRDDLYQIYVT